jgi:hypothetical protein
MGSELKREFLYAAIIDTQETIRAIDGKIEMLLLFLVIPVTALPQLLAQAKNLWTAHTSCAAHGGIAGLTAAFVLSWLVAFFCSFRTLSSISNPLMHIRQPCDATGAFYRGGEYIVSLRDVLANRTEPTSKSTVKDVVAALPGEEEAVLDELAAEQLKVVYIRDIKIIRQRWAYRVAFAWVLVGMIGQCAAFAAGA